MFSKLNKEGKKKICFQVIIQTFKKLNNYQILGYKHECTLVYRQVNNKVLIIDLH